MVMKKLARNTAWSGYWSGQQPVTTKGMGMVNATDNTPGYDAHYKLM